MLIPIRCFTCNKELSCLYMKYLEMIENVKGGVKGSDVKGEGELGKILDKLQLVRVCCRATMMTTVDSSGVLAYR